MILSAKDLALRTPDGRVLIKGLSFDLARGEALFIRGANGIGKSSLLRACLGVNPAAGGTITRQVASNEISFLPQLQNTSMHLAYTLREVLLTAGSPAEVEASIQSPGLLPRDALDRSWNRASGGERQKTLLTRAMLGQKPLLIVDEPMNHLDDMSRKQAAMALAAYTATGMCSLIIVSHQAHDGIVFSNVRSINLEDYTP